MAKLAPDLSLIPIRDVIILPNSKVAFKVGRESSKIALENAITISSRVIALFSQKDAKMENPKIDDLYQIGVLSRIISSSKSSNDQYRVIVQGIKRIKISKVVKSSPCFVVKTDDVIDINSEEDLKLPTEREIKQAISLVTQYKTDVSIDSSINLTRYNSTPGILADILVQQSFTSFDNQVTCLLELNPKKRLKFAYEVLVKEAEQAKIESEISEQATAAIREEHREIFLRAQLKKILEELGEDAPLSLYNPIFRGKNFKVNFNLSFVLMPFAEKFRPIYDEIIKPVVERFGLTCIRADDLYGSKAIIEDIWKLVNEAKIIIADVTGKNPNVFYEIGLAHAVGKEVIIISQTIEDVPFDLRHLRCFIYQDSVAGFRKLESQLQKSLSSIDGLVIAKPQN